MRKRFSRLMSPGNIGTVEIKNRIVSEPMGSQYAGSDGTVTPRIIRFYTEKAKGGTGLIIVEAAYIDQIASKGQENQLGIYGSVCGAGLALLSRAIHDWGARCAVQICHTGGQKFTFTPPMLAPSDGFFNMSRFAPAPPIPITGLTKEQILQTIKAFAAAAERVKLAGFDMVEIHGAHGYLITEFLSPHYNKRTDEYGGSLENRMRFVLEVVQAVKQRVGPDFPVIIRISGTDYEPVDPITLEDSLILARKLEEAGIEAIDVSASTDVNGRLVSPMYQKRGLNVYLADAIKNKSGIKIPVITSSSGISIPDFAEEILSQGKADFIGIGRANLADPYWGKKLESGVPEDVVPCIRCCAGCMGTSAVYASGVGLRCSINPRLGIEEMRNIAPLDKKKKVAVIGGGPGGMEAARLATVRGHDVTLYERRKLGGAMIEAGWDKELKPDIQFLLGYYRTQMKKLKIKVVKEKASVDTVVNGGYDVAIVATGAVVQKLGVPGYNKPHVYTDLQVTGGKDKELGKTVIVAGGGVIAAEIALSQAMKGKKVIMAAPEGKIIGEYEIAQEAPIEGRATLLEEMKANNVQINLGLHLKEITDDGIICVDGKGNSPHFKGDSVVICAGHLPDDTLAKALRGKVKEVRAIGDSVKPRLIGDAIHEGWLAANQI